MAIGGAQRNYDQRWNFAVEIDGLEVAWFMKCSALEAEIGVINVQEGGTINGSENQTPAKVKFSPITLEIGATDNDEIYEWFRLVADAAANSGAQVGGHEKNLAIVQKDRDGTSRKRYNVIGAWPSKYVGGEWDGSSEEIVVEQVTLQIRRWERAAA